MKPTKLILTFLLLQYIHTGHSQRALRCRRGTIPVNGTVCVDCQPGTFEQDDQCLPCPPGTVTSSPRATTCRLCPVGRFTNKFGMQRCDDCPPDSVALNEGSAECVSSCRSGCPQCAPGFGYDAELNECRRCAPGTISFFHSSTPCFPCGSESVPNEDQTKCICPPGLLNGFDKLPSGSCRRCIVGASSPDGFTCVCDPGRTPQLSGSGFSRPFLSQCLCPLGMKDVNGSCEECTMRDIRRFQCNICGSGEGVVNGTCEPCTGNTISRARGLEACEECPDGLVPGQFRSDCVCPGGSGMNEDGECELCQPGFASSRSTGTCSRCGGNGISSQPGSTRCRSCPFGRRPNSSNTRCVIA